MNSRRALLSVWDKTGIVEFGRALVDGGWEVLSTGGTARALREAGVPVTDVSVVTGHPEMMDGRVKTLHPAVHAGLLARRDRGDDMEALAGQGYAAIDLVAVNLYPFRETVASPDVTLGVAMENVDIGGPTMIRAAAKNHRDVWVVVDPRDYGAVLEAVTGEGQGGLEGQKADSISLRKKLAAKVFREISAYDAAVAEYLEGDGEGDLLGEAVTLRLGRRGGRLRYGENPGQSAAFYVEEGRGEGVAALEQLHGKALSYNNILDVDGALLSLAPFAFAPDPAICIVKHTTPCGVAVRDSLAAAFERARVTDPVSAFGGVIAANRVVDRETAEGIASMFVECVVAPGFTQGALEVLTAKKGLRLLALPGDGTASAADGHPAEPYQAEWWVSADEVLRSGARFLARAGGHAAARSFRSVYGGVLFQSLPDPPFFAVDDSAWRVVTARRPTEAEWGDLSFAWAAVAGVKSNAILLAKNRATVGIGAGQMSRVDSSKLAVRKAGEAGLGDELEGCTLASDAFFPFRDGVDAAAEAGARVIVQPGGSIRDEEVIGAADEHGMAMVFTGRRLFRH